MFQDWIEYLRKLRSNILKIVKILVLVLTALILLAPGCSKKKSSVELARYSAFSNEELFKLGNSYAVKGRRVKAKNCLQELIKRGQDNMVTANATILLADVNFKDGSANAYADAIYYYRNLLRYFPKHPRADYCQYQVGICFFEQRNSPDRDLSAILESIVAFKKVINNYPDSLYLSATKMRIRECYIIQAEHEFRIGRFYYRKSLYDAAIKRFEVVFNTYSEYYEEPELYYFAGQSLWDLSRQKEAEFYFNKLIRRFPDSKFSKEAHARMNGKKSPKGFWNRVLPPYI